MNKFNNVKARVDIVIVISGFTRLSFDGTYHKGECPFCKLNTFTVSPHRDIFYCFGCHVSGDVISFIAKVKQISQIEACDWLIKEYKLTDCEDNKQLAENVCKEIIDLAYDGWITKSLNDKLYLLKVTLDKINAFDDHTVKNELLQYMSTKLDIPLEMLKKKAKEKVEATVASECSQPEAKVIRKYAELIKNTDDGKFELNLHERMTELEDDGWNIVDIKYSAVTKVYDDHSSEVIYTALLFAEDNDSE